MMCYMGKNIIQYKICYYDNAAAAAADDNNIQ